MTRVRVRVQKDGLLHARVQVGSRVFICQGPPRDRQFDPNGDPIERPFCVGNEVEKNVHFASMEDRRGRDDDDERR